MARKVLPWGGPGDYIGEMCNDNFEELYADQAELERNLSPSGLSFFVDPTNGDDDNDGTTWALAKKTPQAGIDLTVADRGDTVWIRKGTMTVTTAVLFNKAGITVRLAGYGASPYDQGEKATIWAAEAYTTGPVAIVSAPCRIIGLGFSSRFTTGSALKIDGEGGGFVGGFCDILGCRFPGWGSELYGILTEAGTYNRIASCDFENFTAGIAFGPSVSNNPTDNIVENCVFKTCTYGIEHLASGTPQKQLYRRNWFPSAKGIDFNDVDATGLVADNYFSTATDTGTYDIAVAAAQVHGMEFSGNHYSE